MKDSELFFIWLKEKYNDIDKLLNTISNGESVYKYENTYWKLFKEYETCMREL